MGDSIFDVFKVFDDFFGGNKLVPLTYNCYSSTLPVDVYLKDNKNDLFFDVSIAGYSPEDVAIDFDGDHMRILIQSDRSKREDAEKGTTFIKRGIKVGKCDMHFFVPEKFYKQKDTEATFKDGLLKVKVPALSEKEIESNKVKIKIK